MARALLALALLVGAGGACTTFAFPRPDSTGDGGPDATSDDGASVDATGDDAGDDAGDGASAAMTLLSMDDAARVCAQIFRCPGLAQAIELSLAIPVDTPSSPLSFSGCMDWLAGPIDKHRPGLA